MVKLLLLGLGVSLLCFGWVMLMRRRPARANAHDPRAILRRCRAKLKLVRRELDLIPATREIYELYSDIDLTERTIKHTESWFHHAAGE